MCSTSQVWMNKKGASYNEDGLYEFDFCFNHSECSLFFFLYHLRLRAKPIRSFLFSHSSDALFLRSILSSGSFGTNSLTTSPKAKHIRRVSSQFSRKNPMIVAPNFFYCRPAYKTRNTLSIKIPKVLHTLAK